MKYKILSLTILASLLFVSCEDWLDVKPEGTPNKGNFWKTDKDFTDAMAAVYVDMAAEETWGRDIFWEQGASDDIFFSRSRGSAQMNLANLNMDGNTESSIKDIYRILYKMNTNANNVVYYGVNAEERTPVINNRLGEAYFMRAFSHFMIAYRYGRVDNGVPFVKYEDFIDYDLEVVKIPKQHASVIDNYKLIIEDLNKAEELLSWFKDYDSDDYGCASKDAAIALKVKTYAYWAQHDPEQWKHIPDLVDQLENQGGRGLLDNFAEVFLIENEWSKEYIWSVNSSGKTMAGSIFPGIMLDNKGWTRYNGWGNFKPTLELWAEYDDNDKRRPVTIMQYGDEFVFFGEKRRFYSEADLECGFHFNKYMEPFRYGSVHPTSGTGINNDKVSPNGNRPTTDLNVPIIRFAEMLLFKAEALIEMNKNGEAATVLNRIAKRAGMGEPYSNATIEDLMHERRCELAGEYTDRVMDLKRWAPKYPIAKTRLEAAKHGLKYVDRTNPDSELDESWSEENKEGGRTMVVNGKTYRGVIEIMPAKTYDADKACVLPYELNEIVKAQGALKQNKNY